jgi:hypothetical protein
MDKRYWISSSLKHSKVLKGMQGCEQKQDEDRDLILPEFRQLLEEAGIIQPTFQDLPSSVVKYTCCDELGDNKDGDLVCWGCGKVLSTGSNKYTFYMPRGSYSDGALSTFSNQSNNIGVQMAPKKRFYSPRIHLMNHLKRYLNMSCGTDTIPDTLLTEVRRQVDVHNDRYAYSKVREYLTKTKNVQYYPHVFHIIYQCGGTVPELSPKQMQRLERLIRALIDYFFSIREEMGKNSIPCVPAMLEKLLHQCGHYPFYHLHTLKSEKLMKTAQDFYDAYLASEQFINCS